MQEFQGIKTTRRSREERLPPGGTPRNFFGRPPSPVRGRASSRRRLTGRRGGRRVRQSLLQLRLEPFRFLDGGGSHALAQ